jgi:hypothetical protein
MEKEYFCLKSTPFFIVVYLVKAMLPKVFESILKDYLDRVITKEEAWKLCATLILYRQKRGMDSSEIISTLNKELR